MNSQLSAQFLLTAVAFISVMLGGCGGNVVDLKSLAVFATLSEKAAEKYPKIVKDLDGSCLRAVNFRDREERQKGQENCQENYGTTFQQKTIIPHTALVNYLRTLAAMARDDVISFDPELNNLAGTLQDLDADRNQVSAVSNLFSFVAKAAGDQYRRNQIKQAVLESNNSVLLIVQNLKKIVKDNYLEVQLDIEEKELVAFYQETILSLRQQNQEGLARLAGRKELEEVAVLERRQKDAMTYIAILDEIEQGHNQLYLLFKAGEKVESLAVAQVMLQSTQNLLPLLEDVRNAFN